MESVFGWNSVLNIIGYIEFLYGTIVTPYGYNENTYSVDGCGLMRSVLDCHAGNQGSLPAGDKAPSRSTKQHPPSATDGVNIG